MRGLCLSCSDCLRFPMPTVVVACVRAAEPDLSGGQEGREEPDAAALHQAGPDRHRPSAGRRRQHLPRGVQGVPTDGALHAARRR